MEPILDEDLLEKEEKQPEPFKKRPVILWAIPVFVGILFKMQHWTGGSILIDVSTAGLSAYSLHSYILLKGRNALNAFLSVLSLLWFFILIMGMLFNNGYPYNEKGVLIFVLLFAVFFSGNDILKGRR